MTTTYQITPYFFNSSNLRSATEYPLLISFMLPIVVALVTCQNRPPVAFISQNSCLCVFVFQPAVIFDNNLSLLSIEKPHCFVVYFSWPSILSLLSSGDTLFLLCLFKCTHTNTFMTADTFFSIYGRIKKSLLIRSHYYRLYRTNCITSRTSTTILPVFI